MCNFTPQDCYTLPKEMMSFSNTFVRYFSYFYNIRTWAVDLSGMGKLI